jgi:hypothetical protein
MLFKKVTTFSASSPIQTSGGCQKGDVPPSVWGFCNHFEFIFMKKSTQNSEFWQFLDVP